MNIDENSAPFITEYNTKSKVAVVSDSLLIAALTPNTIANSAITNPQRRILLEYKAVKMPGLVATPYAVAPVIASASVIHTYTFLINTGKAADIESSRSRVIPPKLNSL